MGSEMTSCAEEEMHCLCLKTSVLLKVRILVLRTNLIFFTAKNDTQCVKMPWNAVLKLVLIKDP